jgi:hypothetical protein
LNDLIGKPNHGVSPAVVIQHWRTGLLFAAARSGEKDASVCCTASLIDRYLLSIDTRAVLGPNLLTLRDGTG